MAPSTKRKRTSTVDTSPSPTHRPKRQKNRAKTYVEPSSPEEKDGGEFYQVKRILKERKLRGKLQYLIEWEGLDPQTGRKWPNDWKSPTDITKDLVDEWKENKQKRVRGSAASTPSVGPPETPREIRDRRQANNRVVEDTPETPELGLIRSRRQVTHVQPSQNRDRDLSGYVFHSQLPPDASSPQTSQSHVQTENSSSPGFLQRGFKSSGIVPDSQVEDGSASYVQTTQEYTISGAEESSVQYTQTGRIDSEELVPDSSALPENRLSFLSAAPAIEQFDHIEDSQQSQSQLISTKNRGDSHFVLSLEKDRAEESQEIGIEIPESPTQPEPESIEAQTWEIPTQPDSELIGAPAWDPILSQPGQRLETDTVEDTQVENPDVVKRCAEEEESELEIVAQDAQEEDPRSTGQREEDPEEEILLLSESRPAFVNPGLSIGRDNHVPAQSVEEVNCVTETVSTGKLPSNLSVDPQDQHRESSLADTPVLEIPRAISLANSVNPHLESQVPDFCRFHSVPLGERGSARTSTQSVGQIKPYLALHTSDLALVEGSVKPTGAASIQGQAEEPATVVAAPQLPVLEPQGPTEYQIEQGGGGESFACTDVQSLSAAFEQARSLSLQINCESSKRDKREPFAQADFVESARTSNAPTPTTATTTISDYSHQAREQEAQEIPRDLYTPTQESSIRTTVELQIVEGASIESAKSSVVRAETPQSRHDSSQESLRGSVSSPAPHPPSISLRTDSLAPPRPSTPEGSTVSTAMDNSHQPDPEPQIPVAPALNPTSTEKSAEQLKEEFRTQMNELYRKNREKAAASSSSTRRSRLAASPLVLSSRSPSTIPDHSPRPSEPSSLRTSALANSTAVDMPAAPSLLPPAAAAEAPAVQLDNGDEASESEDEITGKPDNDEDDTHSLLDDDLQLQPEEHIVPLPMHGRQLDMLTHEIQRDKDLVQDFLKNAQRYDDTVKLEKLVQRLRAVETHVDLIWAEADSSSQLTSAMTQSLWDSDSCVKFRFLGALLSALREHDLNGIVVIEKYDLRLLGMVEKFLRGKDISYKFPAKGRMSDSSLMAETLTITILSAEETFIMSPPDFIVCLDGTLNASRIRTKRWATNPDRSPIPVFELVVPRSVSHIERYISPALSPKRRMHTLFATLAQVHDYIGQPMVNSPSAIDAAAMVAEYIIALGEDQLPEWPLPPIGSIKSVIEFSSQHSQEAMPSPPPAGGFKASKRPLDSEPLDPAKRVRLTPQPPSSVASNENEVTHISDSMPGTAVVVSKLQEQLNQEQAMRKASDKRAGQFEAALDRRHNDYEDLKMKYRQALGQIDGANNAKDKAIERLDTKLAELKVVRTEYDEQQQLQLASEDDKIAEIARIRQQLTDTKALEERALKKAESAERTLEYIKEQYREASDRATELNTQNTKLTKDLAIAEKKASKQAVERKSEHWNKVYQMMDRKVEDLENRIRISDRIIAQKEEEIARLAKPRTGYGTRGGSVPRSPQVRGSGSRAASPSASTTRDRVSQIRNG